MDQKIKAPKIVIIFSVTLITIICWVAFEVYRTLTTKPTPPVPANILEPVDPTLDATALTKIQTRIHLDESQIRVVTPRPTSVASPSATPELEVSTASSTPSPTP